MAEGVAWEEEEKEVLTRDFGSAPVRLKSFLPSTKLSVTLDGLLKLKGLVPSKSICMILFQIGAAPVTPDVKRGFSGELSGLPTQTPTTYFGVYPKVQLSFILSEVPVLTDTSYPGI